MRILVVDDEPTVRHSLEDILTAEGHTVCAVANGRAALAAVAASAPDAVVLDVVMPGLDGLGVCRALRAAGDQVPVLMLTARDAVADRVDGLDAGADDYLVKPFAPAELLARLRALLRRTVSGPVAASGLSLDPGARRCVRDGRVIQFSRTEYALLELLVLNARQVLTRDVIMDRVWGYDFGPASNVVGVYIGYLRRKLGEPPLLRTVRGIGYVLEPS